MRASPTSEVLSLIAVMRKPNVGFCND